jgi:hypothetical protein
MRMFSRPWRKRVLPLLLIVLIGLAGRAEASDKDKCLVSQGEHIVDDYYFICRVIDVYGTIDGDLIGVASSITIHTGGVVSGDLWVGGGKLIVEGTVGDDVHFGGLSVAITPSARFTTSRVDVASFALNTEIQQNAVLPGNLLVYGYQATINGAVGGDASFRGEALTINGVVAGQVDAEVGDSRRRPNVPDLPIYNVSFKNPGLVVGPNAYIGSDLTYKTTRASVIPADAVHGHTQFDQTGKQPDITKVAQPNDAAVIIRDYLVGSLLDWLTLFLLGALVLWRFPGLVRHPAQQIRRRTISTIGSGLVMTFMFVVPLVIAIIVLGLIVGLIFYFIKLNTLTIIIGAGMLLVVAGLIGMFGLILFFLGRIVICYLLGQLVYRYGLRLIEPGLMRRWMGTLAVGAAAYALITNIPVPTLGTIIELITALAGVGAVVMYGRDLLSAAPLLVSRAAAAGSADVLTIPVPVSIWESQEPSPGLENLPEGFSGFDDNW